MFASQMSPSLFLISIDTIAIKSKAFDDMKNP
jgi:hypothetical protein